MSAYDNKIIDSDLDAFKNSGNIIDTSVTLSGNVGSGAQADFYSAAVPITSPDFLEAMYDSSDKHSGKFKSLALVPVTLVFNNTTGVDDLGVDLILIISGGTITVKASVFNPYGFVVNLRSTTLNFKFIPYEATF